MQKLGCLVILGLLTIIGCGGGVGDEVCSNPQKNPAAKIDVQKPYVCKNTRKQALGPFLATLSWSTDPVGQQPLCQLLACPVEKILGELGRCSVFGNPTEKDGVVTDGGGESLFCTPAN